jgi:hypothetical protein
MLKRLDPGVLFRIDKQFANRPATAPQPPNQPTDFCLVEDRPYKLRHKRDDDGGICPVEVGTHRHPYRNFRWLPWLPGKVSYVPLAGDIIVTGEMSGCWLVVFILNGVRCFGHIGTLQDPKSQGTVAAINAWKVAVNGKRIIPVAAFNPIAVGMPTPFRFGAIDENDRLFSIGLDKVQASAGTFPYKVLHLTEVTAPATAPALVWG